MRSDDQVVWEEKVDKLGKAILLLMNSKNKAAEKDLCIAYAQGNHSAYPSNMERIARFLSSQYKNKNINPNNNPHDEKYIRTDRRVMKTNWKIRIVATQVLQVCTSEKQHRLKIMQALLPTNQVLVHTLLTSPKLISHRYNLYMSC